jgi:hypothetical protein
MMVRVLNKLRSMTAAELTIGLPAARPVIATFSGDSQNVDTEADIINAKKVAMATCVGASFVWMRHSVELHDRPRNPSALHPDSTCSSRVPLITQRRSAIHPFKFVGATVCVAAG